MRNYLRQFSRLEEKNLSVFTKCNMKNSINLVLWVNSRGVVVSVFDCSLEVSEFEHQSRNYMYFRINTDGKRYKLSYLSNEGLNNIPIVLLQEWFRH